MKKLITIIAALFAITLLSAQPQDDDRIASDVDYVVEFFSVENTDADKMADYATLGSTISLPNVFKSLKNNRIYEAEDMIGLINRNASNEAEYDYAMSLINYNFRRYSVAIEMIDNSLKIEPSASKYYYRALFKKELNLNNSAIDDFTKAMQLDATLESEVSKQLMQTYFADNNYGQAFKYAEMYGNNNPNEIKPYLIKAQVYMLQNKHEGAIGELEQALKYYSSNGKLHALKGSALQKLNKHDEACQSFTIAEKFGYETKVYDKSKCQ